MLLDSSFFSLVALGGAGLTLQMAGTRGCERRPGPPALTTDHLHRGDSPSAERDLGERSDQPWFHPCAWFTSKMGLVRRRFCRLLPGSFLVAIPKLGAAAVFSLVIVGQMIAALILDATGAFGVTQLPFSAVRCIGAVRLLVGVILIQRK